MQARSGAGEEGSVNGAKPLELILNSEFLLFQSCDPDFIPIGIGHLALDYMLDFLVLVGQMVDVSLYRHAFTSSLDFGWRATQRWYAPGPKIQPPNTRAVIPKNCNNGTL
jgi:hypothetical protein